MDHTFVNVTEGKSAGNGLLQDGLKQFYLLQLPVVWSGHRTAAKLSLGERKKTRAGV